MFHFVQISAFFLKVPSPVQGTSHKILSNFKMFSPPSKTTKEIIYLTIDSDAKCYFTIDLPLFLIIKLGMIEAS